MSKLSAADQQFFAQLNAAYNAASPVTEFRPNPGGQEQFMMSQAHEIIAMGANSSGKTYCSLMKIAHHLLPEKDINGTPTGYTIHPHRRIRVNATGQEGWISTWSEKTQRGNIKPNFDKILGPYEQKQGTKVEGGVRQFSQFETGRITFKWQTRDISDYRGEKVDFIMMDEPHKKNIYNESMMRLLTRKGTMWLAATLIADASYTEMQISDVMWMQDEIIDPWLEDPDQFPELEIVFMTMEENKSYLDLDDVKRRLAHMSKDELLVRTTGRLILKHGNCWFDDDRLKVIKEYLRTHPKEAQPKYGRLEYDDQNDDDWKVKFNETRTFVDPYPKGDFTIKIWQEPIDRHTAFIRPDYFIGVDAAEGKSGKGDYTSVCVKRADSGEEVAALHGHLTEIELAKQLYLLGMYYCDRNFEPARIAIEVNNIGRTTQAFLLEGNPKFQIPKYPRDRIYHRPSEKQLQSGLFTVTKEMKPGWQTTNGTRHFLLTSMRQDVLNTYEAIQSGGTPTIKDIGRIEEALYFILWASGKYQAAPGKFDDKLFGAAICDQVIKRYYRQPKPIQGGDERYTDEDRYYIENGRVMINEAAFRKHEQTAARPRRIAI